jgi:hypothetical protein
VDCSSEDECHDSGACQSAVGTCLDQRKLDGTPCNGGSCDHGVCKGQGPEPGLADDGVVTASTADAGTPPDAGRPPPEPLPEGPAPTTDLGAEPPRAPMDPDANGAADSGARGGDDDPITEPPVTPLAPIPPMAEDAGPRTSPHISPELEAPPPYRIDQALEALPPPKEGCGMAARGPGSGLWSSISGPLVLLMLGRLRRSRIGKLLAASCSSSRS